MKALRYFKIHEDLREIFSYKNEIRASGQILPDQLIFLLKCGFNSVEIDKTKKDTWLNIFKSDSRLDYQKWISLRLKSSFFKSIQHYKVIRYK